MKKYSILIVGYNCYTGHLREFIVNLKKNNPQVDITLAASKIREEFRNSISESVNDIVMIKVYKGKMKIPFLAPLLNVSYLIWCFFKLRFRRHFDIVDIHFPNSILSHVMPILRKMTKNIVITPWGSDVMRVKDKKSIKRLTKIYSQAKYVTVSGESQIGKCAIAKFNVNPEIMVKLGWGGEFFDFIREHSEKVSTEEAKKRFGLNDRYVITCGYNTQKSQRHEEIIDAIYSVKKQLPENLTILIPCTYVFYKGKSVQKELYVESIREKAKLLGLDVVVIEEHLDLPDLLKLRMATDIFVHVQTTDAGSRSVMEYVFCNKKVVHGAWVRYAYLEDYNPSCYFPVDKIENLGNVIVKACQSEIEELPQVVKNIILERGWSNRMTKWNNFFESMV